MKIILPENVRYKFHFQAKLSWHRALFLPWFSWIPSWTSKTAHHRKGGLRSTEVQGAIEITDLPPASTEPSTLLFKFIYLFIANVN